MDAPELNASDMRETRSMLTGLARGRFGHIAPERIAERVLAATEGADWPVRRAAVEALARRFASAEREGLTVARKPRSTLGAYRTARSTDGRGELRPYTIELLAVEPVVRTSCGCADFVRSSLGLCKHGLVVLETLERVGDLPAQSAESVATPRSTGTSERRSTRARKGRPRIEWAAEIPLRGSVDRLARMRLVDEGAEPRVEGFRGGVPVARVLAKADARLELVASLEQSIREGALDAEPAVYALLAEERVRAERRAASKATARDCARHLPSLRRALYPFQREGVSRFFETGRLLLADDMGLGKTTQAIAACHGAFGAGRIARGLLIVPAALKPQWKREWDAMTDVPLALVDGSPPERARLYRSTKHGFLCVGYEQLLRDLTLVQGFAPELVVLDEAQRIKNWATKSAAYVKALRPSHRLVLTGTPMENRFAELASIMDFVDDVALEPKWRLVPWHTVHEGNAARGLAGVRNLDTLRERLSDVMVRRLRKDVIAQLPERTDTRLPVEMTDAQRAEHDGLNLPIARLVAQAARRPLPPHLFLRLMSLLATQRMICNGLAQVRFDEVWPRCEAVSPTAQHLDELFTPKLSALRGLVEQVVVAQGRRAVVFSQWRNMLRLAEWSVRDLLASAGMRAVFFTGAESAKLRERAIVDFHDDPGTTVMFLSDAGGVGLNLQRAATCCINLELPWNPAVLEQRIGRIHRIGQDQPIDVYNLVTEDGIESRIATLVGQKQVVFSSLFDGTSDEVRFDGDASFLEGIRKLVEPVVVPSADVLDEPDADASESPLDTDESQSAPSGERPAADVSESDPRAVASGTPTTPSALSITRLPDGGLRIDAPAAMAEPLAALLESLARSLRDVSRTGGA